MVQLWLSFGFAWWEVRFIWCRFGADVVTWVVAWLYLVQLWFTVGSVVIHLCVALVQLWCGFGSVA